MGKFWPGYEHYAKNFENGLAGNGFFLTKAEKSITLYKCLTAKWKRLRTGETGYAPPDTAGSDP